MCKISNSLFAYLQSFPLQHIQRVHPRVLSRDKTLCREKVALHSQSLVYLFTDLAALAVVMNFEQVQVVHFGSKQEVVNCEQIGI